MPFQHVLYKENDLWVLTWSAVIRWCCWWYGTFHPVRSFGFEGEDFLDINALCAGSIAAITTGAAAVAPYGAAIHVGCRHNALMKNPQEMADMADGGREMEEGGGHDGILE